MQKPWRGDTKAAERETRPTDGRPGRGVVGLASSSLGSERLA